MVNLIFKIIEFMSMVELVIEFVKLFGVNIVLLKFLFILFLN